MHKDSSKPAAQILLSAKDLSTAKITVHSFISNTLSTVWWISAVYYNHTYAHAILKQRGLPSFSIDEYIRNCMLVICNIKFMNVYILFTWIFSGCKSSLLFLIENHHITIIYWPEVVIQELTVINLQKSHEKGLTDEIA